MRSTMARLVIGGQIGIGQLAVVGFLDALGGFLALDGRGAFIDVDQLRLAVWPARVRTTKWPGSPTPDDVQADAAASSM